MTTEISGTRPPVPRPEHPRPQWHRPEWLTLNGLWEFESDKSDSGEERGLLERPLAGRILVPFAPESELSGVGEQDFMEAVWYRRTLVTPSAWRGKRILLHFGACDYDTTAWVSGVEVGRHRGGFTSFTFDITDALPAEDEAVLLVRARDSRYGPKARGKQARDYQPSGVLYGRTTGIWQSVWLEAVPTVHLRRARITPDLAASRFHLEVPVSANPSGQTVQAVLSDERGVVARAETRADLDLAARLVLEVPADRVRCWGPGDPHLYRLRLTLVDGAGAAVDEVDSYAGLRSVAIDGTSVRINGVRVFQRLVLDQGYYPDGIMTAPTDEALAQDIRLALAAGFNGARLHQKVFEERFLYHADRLGYLIWAEFGDWGCDEGGLDDNQRPDPSYVSQWLEAVERDYSHPSIIGWCPLNETHQNLDRRVTVLDDVTRAMFLATKAMDTSRPVLDTSGYAHRVPESDIYDSHNYEQDPERFREQMADLAIGRPYTNRSPQGTVMSVPYGGQPYFCSEFGGIWWRTDRSPSACSWGYGHPPEEEEGVYERFDGLVRVLLDDPNMFGYCYTQLTDVYQENNGIYHFDRSEKLDIARIRASQSRLAAAEALDPGADADDTDRASGLPG